MSIQSWRSHQSIAKSAIDHRPDDSGYRLIVLYLDNLAQSGKFTLGKFSAESYAVFPCPQHQRQFCIKPATRTGNLRPIAGLPGHCSALSW